jgi:uncharacterized protein (DUF433 family)
MNFKHITFNKSVLDGKPIITHTRISVEMIMEWIATGATVTQIYEKYTHLPIGSVEEAINYAAQFSKNDFFLQEAI